MTDATDFERQVMAEVADHACRLHQNDRDIVFTAAIIKDGEVICHARNTVGDTDDVSRHAEVVAMAEAAEKLGTRDLSGTTLLASCQPCEMCLAAMRWAQIDRVIFAAQKANAGDAFFRFPGLEITDFQAACDGGFSFVGGVCEDAVAHIYRSDA